MYRSIKSTCLSVKKIRPIAKQTMNIMNHEKLYLSDIIKVVNSIFVTNNEITIIKARVSIVIQINRLIELFSIKKFHCFALEKTKIAIIAKIAIINSFRIRIIVRNHPCNHISKEINVFRKNCKINQINNIFRINKILRIYLCVIFILLIYF